MAEERNYLLVAIKVAPTIGYSVEAASAAIFPSIVLNQVTGAVR
jgi:hypothetical protein